MGDLTSTPGRALEPASRPARRASARRRRARPVAFHTDAPRRGKREHADGTVASVLLTEFDVSAYTLEAAGPIEVDAQALRESLGRLPAAALTALREDLNYLWRVESAALDEVRTMYSSWTANEARITAFLATWLWERFWWARALAELRDALPSPTHHTSPGEPADTPFTDAAPRLRSLGARLGARLGDLAAGVRRRYVQHLLPMTGPAWTALAGEQVTAGHMARMAIQEGSLLAALRALRPRTADLAELPATLEEIITRRTRTLAFFRDEAIARITRSPGEARTARLVLAVTGSPLRPAGVQVPGEHPSLQRIFARAEDRAALRSARHEITRLLPGPDLHPSITSSAPCPSVTGGPDGIRP